MAWRYCSVSGLTPFSCGVREDGIGNVVWKNDNASGLSLAMIEYHAGRALTEEWMLGYLNM